MRFRPALRSPLVAALLSFLLPGLGQAASGALRRAAIVVAPTVAIAVAALLIGLRGFAKGAFQLDFLAALLVVDIVALAYHLWAIFDAYRIARPRVGAGPRYQQSPRAPRQVAPAATWPSRGAGIILAVLVVATVLLHGTVAYVDVKEQQTLSSVFADVPTWMGGGSPAPGQSDAPYDTPPPGSSYTPPPDATDSPTPSTSPSPTPNPNWSADGMLNLLVVGSDAGPGRWSLRTDTMILLQVKLSTGQAAMYGIPRNLYNVPLGPDNAKAFGCHCFPYPNMLNALYRYAMDNPKYFPGGDARGFKALEGAVGAFLGVSVDGSAVINLQGFVALVNSLGGIYITVPTELRDTQYPYLDHPGTYTIDIKAGFQHMDGLTALEYARSRHSTDDYDRMKRQQAVLLALRKTIAHPCSLVPRIPSILDAISGTFWTDMPMDSASAMLAVAERVGSGNIASYTFAPPNTPEYLTAASIAAVRNIVKHGLDNVPVPSPSGGGSGGGGGLSC